MSKKTCNQCGAEINPESECVYAKDYPALCDKCRLKMLIQNEHRLRWCPNCRQYCYPDVYKDNELGSIYVMCPKCKTGLETIKLSRFFNKEA